MSNITREQLLAQAAKDREYIERLSPGIRAALDMELAQLNQDIARSRQIDEAARTSSQ